MKITPDKPKAEERVSTVCICYHCGERTGSGNGVCAMLCKFCRTDAQREEMHEANRALNPAWECRVCKYVAEVKARKAAQALAQTQQPTT